MVQGKQKDTGAERHEAGLGGHAGENGDGLEIAEGRREVVLARPHGIEADRGGEPDLLEVFQEAAGLRVVRRMLYR
jgi:hypothetical protein